MADPILYARPEHDEWFWPAPDCATPADAAALYAEEHELDKDDTVEVIRATEAASVEEDHNAEDDGWPLVPVPGDRWVFRVTGGPDGEVEEVRGG